MGSALAAVLLAERIVLAALGTELTTLILFSRRSRGGRTKSGLERSVPDFFEIELARERMAPVVSLADSDDG